MSEAGIAARFSAGARQYDAHASVQQRMATEFARWLCESAATFISPEPLQMTELGCGTGFLTQEMLARYPNAKLDACDLSSEMLTQCHIRTQGAVALHQADAATFTVKPACDWILSSFCLQWVDDIRSVLTFHASQATRLSICLPCSASFDDWRHAHQTVGLKPALWPLPDAGLLIGHMQQLADKGGADLRSHRLTASEQHDSPLAFARHLRAIGADYSSARGAGTALKRVLDLLPSPYVANYEVLMLDLQF